MYIQYINILDKSLNMFKVPVYYVISVHFANILYMSGMVFNATFNNISFISWLSILFVEESEYPEKR
jgi:hypothetical protein